MHLLKSFLQQVALLTEEEWRVSEGYFRPRRLRKGELFVQEGQTVDKIAFIETGLFKLFYQHKGKEKVMLLFAEGEFMTDYFSYLTQTPSIRPIQALEDSSVYTISRDSLNQLLEKSLEWNRIARIMAEKSYVLSVQRANRLLHDDQLTRVQTFLRERPGLFQRVPQYIIASYLNMSPETLSRIKRKLMDQPPQKLSIHDPLDATE